MNKHCEIGSEPFAAGSLQELLGRVVGAAGARFVAPGRAVALPGDFKVEDVAWFADVPWRDAKTVHLLTLPELVRFVKAEGAEASAVVFCGHSLVRAALNYYRPGTCEPGGWADSAAQFAMQFSPEWKGWKEMDGHRFGQEEFCEFLEDHESTIVDPRGAELVNLAANFRQNMRVEFSSSYRTADGQTRLSYNESKTGASRELAVPAAFMLRVPVLQGAEEMSTYEVKARLRVRVDKESHKLSFVYALVRPDVPEDMAVHDVAEYLRQQLPGARVHEGRLDVRPAAMLRGEGRG